jgi:CheY-like chemotaxis protein/HPt (histidine-containing phosphotransfer) domain-containing protein
VVIPYQTGNQKDITQISSQVRKDKLLRKSLSNLNVLLVEDNDINRLYAINILKTWNCKVDTAENGLVALEKLKSSSFDIILMDIQMPFMDGFEATKAIRNGTPPKSEIPIIALTANATKKDIEKCMASKMDDCIPKPFTPNELLKVLLRFSEDDSRPKINASRVYKTAIDLNYLRQISNNNPKFIQEMAITFGNTMPEAIEQIKLLTKAESWMELAKVIHKIRPSLTMMGLHHAKKLSLEIEQNCKSNSKGISLKMVKFINLLELAIRELRTITS